MKVYKYELNTSSLGEPFPVEMPVSARILRVGLDPRGKACVWALVDPDAPNYGQMFVIYGTGHEVNPIHDYVDSFNDGPFVWHLFIETAGSSDETQMRWSKWDHLYICRECGYTEGPDYMGLAKAEKERNSER